MNTTNTTTEEKDLDLDATKPEVQEQLTAEDKAKLPMLEEMMKAGLIYGRKKSKLNPKMKSYVYTVRNGIAIFDLLKTLENLDKTTEFIKDKISKGGKILFVATQASARDLAENLAKESKQFYITARWLGGTLTNFKTINSRVERFKKMKADKAAGRLEKYTKKERLMMDKEMEKSATLFSGIEEMTELPSAVFVIDAILHETAVREANRTKIPVIAFTNSDTDPDKISYLIPGNCNSRPSISWVLDKIASALK